MEPKTEYKFDKSTGILYKYYHGHVNLKVITSSWQYAFDNNIIPKNVKGFILDFRDATLKMNIKETSRIADFYGQHSNVFKNKKVGLIMQEPEQVVFPIAIELENIEFFPRPFYTETAAIKWILKG
ncbi:MAG: hypothetical protein JSV22_05515 [Bacteroidales bacterium]|nr:MAG: hypothetical protein JSV22_05515 [Bacteroidales bacterium]